MRSTGGGSGPGVPRRRLTKLCCSEVNSRAASASVAVIGGLISILRQAFDSADPVRTRSAFPSLHCSLALLTLIYSYRFSDAVFPRFPRLWFRIVLPFVVSLWISTVYLRHHWVVDIFAGLALGANGQRVCCVDAGLPVSG